jgi:hypothetical protein
MKIRYSQCGVPEIPIIIAINAMAKMGFSRGRGASKDFFNLFLGRDTNTKV